MLKLIGALLAIWIVLWLAMSILGMVVQAAFWLFVVGIVVLGGLALVDRVSKRKR
ncbi:hypothetical protein RIF23_08185 [Lipingzhangella sp. LS1_29]|uniref:Uncharacterized protein n=1 Tax=Lipingzhangella rawalii TaxID=2055835 RepID=A0ABU2H5Y3_9ACTN|nr:hypothetical protein [Lipingzhangella rawalii]MDS1270270.1 hypothetical protein [Lipingzhangella rawalii]